MTLETLGATRVAVSRLFYCLACLFLLPGLQAQIATIPVGNGPVAAAVNPNTNKVYVANQGSDSVSVIDGTTNTVVSTVALSATANGVRGPRAITIDTAANLIYVADEASQDLAVIDGGTDTLIRFISLLHVVGTITSEFHPDALALDSNSGQLYIGTAGCGIAILDVPSGTVTYPSTLCQGTSIAVNTNTDHFFIAYEGDSTIEDRDSNFRLIPNDPQNRTSRNLQIQSFASDYVCQATRDPICGGCPNLPCVANLNPQAVVLDGGLGQAFVLENEGAGLRGALRSITDTNSPTISRPVLVDNNPYSLALNPQTHHLYAANQGTLGATVSILQGQGVLYVVAEVPVGSSAGPKRTGDTSCTFGIDGPTIPAPNKIGIDEANNLAFVANECSNNVTVIDGATSSIITTAPAGNYPFAVAWNPVNGNTYVVNFGSTTNCPSATCTYPPGTVTVYGAFPKLPAVSLSSNALLFGSQEAGTTSPPQTVVLSNNGAADLTVQSVMANTTTPTATNSIDYSVSGTCAAVPVVVHPGQSCSILVQFTSNGSGPSAGNVAITFAGPPSATINLSGTGVLPSVTFSPSFLTFGPQAVNTFSSVQPVTITNHTAKDIKAFLDGGLQFTENSDDCGYDPVTADSIIPAGQSCTAEVQFTPTSTGPVNGVLQLIDDYTNPGTSTPITDSNGNPYSVALSGVGTDGSITLLPSALTFGSQVVNASGATQVLTITNRKLVQLHISAIQFTSPEFSLDSENCTAGLVALQTSCEVAVKFVATGRGVRLGQMIIADNVNHLQLAIPLTGLGTSPGVTVSPSSMAYGMQVLGAAGPAQSITITNTDPANPLVIQSVKLVGDFNATLSTVADTCTPAAGQTTTLAALAGSCSMRVAFTANAPQALSGQLVIVDSSADSPRMAAITGVGGASTLFTVTPPSLSFSGAATTAVLFNDQFPSPEISNVSTIGADFGETDNCAAGSSSCSVQVTFAPVASGLRVGQLTIDDPGHPNVSPAIVALSGNSLPPGANTPVGNVVVTPVAQDGSTPVTVIFDNVTGAGQTSLNVSGPGNCPTPPTGGFQLGNPGMCYDISTTAQFAGQATVCINYTGVAYTDPTQLVLFHYELNPPPPGWVRRSFYNNTTQHLICAHVTSFSPFEILEKVKDTTPPVIVPVISGTLGSNGWYTSNVSLTWNVSDPESAISATSGCDPASVNSDTPGITFTCTATSAGGTASKSVVVKRDATPPSAMMAVTVGTLGADGWYTSNVTVATSGSDAISPPVMCTAPQVLMTETAGQTFSGSCTNQAGLIGSASPLVVKLDRTAPTITIASPANGAVYTRNQKVPATYSCSDNLSGVTNCTGGVVNGTYVDTSSIGAKSLTVNATDVAGNASSQTVNYQVVCHYLTITPAPSSIAQGGIVMVKSTLSSCANVAQTIAIRFTLTGLGEGHSCSSSTTEMFTTPMFLLPANTLQSFSFPSRVPSGLCPGTYSIQSTILIGGQAVDTSTATLTVTPR